jgi:hydroxymethylpyrimidine/phosphomethylpyrimidine kinase
VLSIAGYDPSGGAGLLADIKTFEANKVYGLGVMSANTVQNDCEFISVQWLGVEKIAEQIEILARRFSVQWVKIGLVESAEALEKIVSLCKKTWAGCRIIWDPVLSASAGFRFHPGMSAAGIEHLLREVYLLTPNAPEAEQLAGDSGNAGALSKYCHVFLKGGHRSERAGYDQLYTADGKHFSFRPRVTGVAPKHGSGCVLSSALAANLAKGETLHRSCLLAKEYTGKFLKSNESLLGYHKL